MEVLTALGVLIGVAATGWACWAVRDYAWKYYGYNIFSKGTLAYMILPLGLLYISFKFVPSGQTYWGSIMAGDLNMILMVALIATSLIGFCWYLASQTNIWVAIFASVVLIVAAIAIIIIICMIAIARSGNKKTD